jgi:hypothetical protein
VGDRGANTNRLRLHGAFHNEIPSVWFSSMRLSTSTSFL